MQKCVRRLVVSVFALMVSAVPAFCGLVVNSPGIGASVQNPVRFVASASSSCAKGIAAVGIYDNNKLVAVSNGTKLDTNIYLSSGTHSNVVVQSWDNCGNVAKVPTSLKVTSKTFYNVEENKGWLGYGELPPIYDICTNCRPLVEWGMKQGLAAPVVSGASTRFDIGGTHPYSDVLWTNHLIGDGSTQGLLDSNESLSSTIHNLVYDVYFYAPTLAPSYALEFDTGQYVGGRGFLFGTMCVVEGTKHWAVWDNPNAKWIHTSLPCNVVSGQWNHLVQTFQRTADNRLLYKTITLNGVTQTLNWLNNSIPSNWHGIVINFQLDGNHQQQAYSVYLDNLHITYY